MSGKTTGLAAFTRSKGGNQVASAKQLATTDVVPEGRGRRRGQGETVALTVRLSRGDWERLHQLAVAEGVSLQSLALTGLSRIFIDKGLPALKS
jgi:hypothetical protein